MIVQSKMYYATQLRSKRTLTYFNPLLFELLIQSTTQVSNIYCAYIILHLTFVDRGYYITANKESEGDKIVLLP